MKQGFWYEYKTQKILTTDSLRQNPIAIGFHNNEGGVDVPVAEGYYKDNKRIGQWKFYKGLFYNDNYANPTSHEQPIIFTDSGFFRIIDTFWHFIAKISNDTTSLTGIINLTNHSINVFCKDKKCYLFNPFKNKKERFLYKDLDNMLILLNYYDKRIRVVKIGS